MRCVALLATAALLSVAGSAHAAKARPGHRAFGYSYAGDSDAGWSWDVLTDVAFFSETMHTDGTITTASWLASGPTLVAAAHAHDARCVLTITLFNPSGANDIHTFLASPAAVNAGIAAIVAAVVQNGGDGVNIDFEFVASADKAAFTTFIAGLATAMHAAVPGSDVSIATPGAGYPGYDLAALGAAADTLMIMAYDYHYAGSDPGPVAPLANSTLWGAGSQKAAIELFKSKVDPSHLVVGLPLYGYDYYTTSTAVPGTHVAGTTASAVTYKSTETLAPMYGRLWDAASSTPYYVFMDANGKQRQTFYDDAESLGAKIDQAVAEGIDGVGLWELSYAAPSFWTLLDAKLGGATVVTPDAGLPDARIPDAPAIVIPGPPDAAVAAADDGDVSGGCAVATRHGSPWLWIGLGLLFLKRRST